MFERNARQFIQSTTAIICDVRVCVYVTDVRNNSNNNKIIHSLIFNEIVFSFRWKTRCAVTEGNRPKILCHARSSPSSNRIKYFEWMTKYYSHYSMFILPAAISLFFFAFVFCDCMYEVRTLSSFQPLSTTTVTTIGSMFWKKGELNVGHDLFT